MLFLWNLVNNKVGLSKHLVRMKCKVKLKPRLAGVASLVPCGSVVADIGTDHAYLPIHLVRERNCPKVIAIDKSANNTKKAEEAVSLSNLGDKVEIRTGDGLSALGDSDGVEIIVMAGIGGRTICKILIAAGKSLWRFQRIVLQPMGDLPLVRRWLFAQGFCFFREKLAREKDRFYEIIAAEKGKEIIHEPVHLELGPHLVRGEDPLVIPWLKEKIRRYEGILQDLSRSRAGQAGDKWKYYDYRRRVVREVLDDIYKRIPAHFLD